MVWNLKFYLNVDCAENVSFEVKASWKKTFYNLLIYCSCNNILVGSNNMTVKWRGLVFSGLESQLEGHMLELCQEHTLTSACHYFLARNFIHTN